MTTPRFYYYPYADGTVEIVNLAENLSDLQVTPVRDAVDGVSAHGGRYRTSFRSLLQVRITLENFTSESLRRDLESMQCHLERGGMVGFALNHGKAWAAWADALPDRGDLVVTTGGNVCAAWNASAGVAGNDVVVIESANPEAHREFCTIDSVTGDNLTLSDAVRYMYAEAPVSVRHRDFFPVLRWPDSQVGNQIVLSNRRIAYTLDVTLVTDPVGLEAITGDILAGSTMYEGAAWTDQSLEEIFRAGPAKADTSSARDIDFAGNPIGS